MASSAYLSRSASARSGASTFVSSSIFKFRRRLLGELCRAAARSHTVYFEALTGEDLVPGIIAAVQTFGDRINFHPHLHLLVTEGGVDRVGRFHRIPRLDDVKLADVFAREVLKLLADRGLLSPEWAERILSWRHTGFNVHCRVRARTKFEAERAGKYAVVDRIIRHLELTFVAEKPPPCHILNEVVLMAAEETGEHE